MTRSTGAAARKPKHEVDTPAQFRFSGHETFACRFAWLPKACQMLRQEPELWSSDEDAMVRLGLGKNMVRSLRFWAAAMGVVTPGTGRTPAITEFGAKVFAPNGYDPYIEHSSTPWLLHWALASNTAMPLFSWHTLFNRWPYPEFSRSDVLKTLARESRILGYDHSEITLSQHFDVLLHTYLPSRANVNLEDSLDGPLTDLRLLEHVGDRKGDGGRREPIYSFRRGRKPEVSDAVFDFALHDFWRRRHDQESTLSLREICVGDGSPGRIFLLSEDDVRQRLEQNVGGTFEYLPSAISGRIVLSADRPIFSDLLGRAYSKARS
ncbi:DUF4007 family protein [Bradyrhizobium sp. UFLA05-109]